MIENLFLNIGAMKAGTTWLYDQLCAHPEITFVPEKEIHYFFSVTGRWNMLSQEARIQKFFANANGKNPQEFQEDIAKICWYANYASSERVNNYWYQSLFNGAKGKYCADFCNLNSNINEAGWRRVRQNFSQKLKVTYCLRDPFKRVWSHYKFHMDWIGRGENIISDGFDGFRNLLEEDWFKEIVRYDLVIKRLENNLTKDEFKIFYFEDFRASPQSALDQLCEFLEIGKIDKSESELNNIVNASQNIKIPDEWSDFLWDYLDPVYAALDEKGFGHADWIRRA